jgi:DNA processing protein
MTPDPGLASWLQLTLTPGLGTATIRELLSQFGLPENVLAARRSELSRFASAEALRALDSDAVTKSVERALAWLEQAGNAAVTLADAAYPRLLLETADPPALLYCRGRTELLNRPALAVVGSRNATAQGASNAEQFARSFSAAGLTIVSGLAQGIDAAAHRGGLTGEGSTIAVLGTGVDNVYPRANAALADEIASRGLLISEFALGTQAFAHNFPRRAAWWSRRRSAPAR